MNGIIAGAGMLVFAANPDSLLLHSRPGRIRLLPRAALLDRLMGWVGLGGRSFIPMLSSFACAIPGIMAARTIADPRDRLVTIMIARVSDGAGGHDAGNGAGKNSTASVNERPRGRPRSTSGARQIT